MEAVNWETAIADHKPKMLQLCAVGFTVEKLLLPLVDEMRKYYEVTVCMSYDSATDRLKSRGYHIENIHIDRKISPLSNIKSIMALYRLMKKKKYTVVHVHTPVAGILGRIASKMAKIPVIIYTAHGFYFHENMPPLKKIIFIFIEKIGGMLSHFVFTQSNEDYQTAVRRKIIGSDKLETIGNGVDVMRFDKENIDTLKVDALKLEFGFRNTDVVVGIIGRVVREKGYMEWINAAKVVLEDHSNVKFLAVGDMLESDRDGIKQGINTFLEANNISGNVIFAGSRTEIPELLSIMDIFTLPSYREGMPRSIIEAMSMSRPVIATDIRGCREEVIDGETGYLVPTSDYRLLAEKITYLVENPEVRIDMGIKARQRVLKEFDERDVLEKQVTIINKLCGLI